MVLRIEAQFACDPGHWQPRLPSQRLGAVYPSAQDVSVGRYAEGPGKSTREVETRQSCNPCDLGERQRTSQILCNVFAHQPFLSNRERATVGNCKRRRRELKAVGLKNGQQAQCLCIGTTVKIVSCQRIPQLNQGRSQSRIGEVEHRIRRHSPTGPIDFLQQDVSFVGNRGEMVRSLCERRPAGDPATARGQGKPIAQIETPVAGTVGQRDLAIN